MELFYARQANREKVCSPFRLVPGFPAFPISSVGRQCFPPGYTERGTAPRVATLKMISFSNTNKQYGKQLLFVDASFQLNPGEKDGPTLSPTPISPAAIAGPPIV